MIHHLENENLKVAVISKGAELKSVFDKTTQQELLWQADPAFWRKSSPVLFPIVGTLKDDTYIYNQKKYKLSRHGFARDYNFILYKMSDTQVIFSLESSAETLKIYPFSFRLQIIYTLNHDSLKVEYIVENLSDEEIMYFSLGAHPAFNVGNTPKDFDDYKLFFNNDPELNASYLNNGLLKADQHTILLNYKTLVLNYKLFENDALVLLNMKSDKITLLDGDNTNLLTFEFENFPYFGLWTVKDSGFICLEPWAGFSDFEDHNQQLTDKLGINILHPQESWSGSWIVTILL